MSRQPGRATRPTAAPAGTTPCLACTRALDPITTVEHKRCVGWMLTASRADLPMTPCTCTVCWPGGQGRPPAPADPLERIRVGPRR